MCYMSKTAVRKANSVDQDQTAPKEQSDLGLHSLLIIRHLCPNVLVWARSFKRYLGHCYSTRSICASFAAGSCFY